jgi:hypothetical protein
MPKRKSGGAEASDRYWEKRLRSKAFRRDLTGAIGAELRALGGEKIKDVLDAKLVRRLITEWDPGLIDRDIVASLVIQGNRSVLGRLQRRGDSLLGLLDEQLVADFDALLDEDVDLSADAEDFVANLMQQEFVRRLFTDIIFTSIVSFYRKVNPLFGAVAMRVLEEQIKGFIGLVMPMIVKQATSFAVSQANQRVVLDFTRSIVRELLDEPLPSYTAMISAGQRKKAEAFVRKAVKSDKLDALIRETAVATWDDLYRALRNRKVGDLLRLEEHAGWLAERIVELVLPALARPGFVQLVASEVALAGRETPQALPVSPRRRAARL